jgi:quinoprotein relay system zinc metallohydrolase 2
MEAAVIRIFRRLLPSLVALVALVALVVHGVLGIAVAAGTAEVAGAGQPHPAAAAGSAGLALREIAPGVLVHVGAVAVASAGNAGDIANLGVIVGTRCVAIIDTGGSAKVGQGLRDAIAARTGTPVCYVINTHAHPDHILGNGAFDDPVARPEFIGHARLGPAIAARGGNYLAAARRDLGAAAGATTLVAPTRTVDGRTELDLGERRIELTAWPTAHTDQDLTVLDPTTGVMFMGDLVFEGHLPVVDGNLAGWLAAHERLATMSVAIAVPGHGEPGPLASLLGPQRAYLLDLRDRVRAAIRERQPLAATVDSLARLPATEGSGWQLVDDFHRRNVTAAYAELEWDD